MSNKKSHEVAVECMCPTCGAALSRARWEEVLQIAEAKEQALLAERDQLAAGLHRLAADRKKLTADRKQLTAQRGKLQAQALKKAEARFAKERKQLEQERTAARAAGRKEAAAEQRKALDEAKAAVKALHKAQRTERSRHSRENTQLKAEVAKLQRKLDAQDGAGHFGPEGERDLYTALTRAFPSDVIEQKGRGGDVLHRVVERGAEVGVVVFEVKNTGQWATKYLRQLRADMERHGTRYGALVVRTLPAGERGMCIRDGVVVVTPPLARYVAAMLRTWLVRMAVLERAGRDTAGKAAQLVAYLRSDAFRTAMDAVAGRIETLRKDLDAEKATHQRMWRERAQSYADIALRAAGIDEQVRAILEGAEQESGESAPAPVRLVG